MLFIIRKERTYSCTCEDSRVRFSLSRKTFEIRGFKALIDRIAESKGVGHEDILVKLNANEGPSLNHVTEVANKEITGRMTDTAHYT